VASAYASASSPEILAHFDVCQTCLLDAVKVPAQSAGDPRRLTKACLAVAKVFSGGQHPGRGVGTSQAPLKLGGQSGEVSCLSISCQERVQQDRFDRSGCHSLAIDRIEGTGSIAQHDEILRDGTEAGQIGAADSQWIENWKWRSTARPREWSHRAKGCGGIYVRNSGMAFLVNLSDSRKPCSDLAGPMASILSFNS
jgi:hypothetical protein